MFGWLAAHSTPLCRHVSPTILSRRMRRITPQRLLRTLPDLGVVLYLHATSSAVISEAHPPGLLVAQRAFAPLLDTHWLCATSVVTDDGPREWWECIDRLGRPRARLHLLPDTDYLAWDAVTAPHESDIGPSAGRPGQWLRPNSARVVSFSLCRFAGLYVLDYVPAASLSPLGSRVALHIANAESAVLQK
ncbi:hypothetical protein [Dyella psychrodurans]|uniref:Uncharacterized protein n=1 Tax=Dyella psychrodurans TaxID=1927960 RepID=A0A370X290_9GAMM|nr:hypothetical protein [Dyella psychrodurans]RDS82476.1 hypothetical protein DWU99_13785 [Dyella psychrodurans]